MSSNEGNILSTGLAGWRGNARKGQGALTVGRLERCAQGGALLLEHGSVVVLAQLLEYGHLNSHVKQG